MLLRIYLLPDAPLLIPNICPLPHCPLLTPAMSLGDKVEGQLAMRINIVVALVKE